MIQNKENALPIYLFSDSQLLFWKMETGQYFLQDELTKNNTDIKNAVYVGASNGDVPEYFDLFQSAMETMQPSPSCHFVKSDDDLEQSKERLTSADLILLAGGDIELGWTFIKSLKETLEDCYSKGVMLMGISAGAIHLASLGWINKEELCASDLFATTGLVSCLIGAHEEDDDWGMLKQAISLTSGCFPGVGIPFGGGVMVDNEGFMTAIRKPVVYLGYEEKKIRQSLLLPEDNRNVQPEKLMSPVV